jgi:hypothetical protein
VRLHEIQRLHVMRPAHHLPATFGGPARGASDERSLLGETAARMPPGQGVVTVSVYGCV